MGVLNIHFIQKLPKVNQPFISAALIFSAEYFIILRRMRSCRSQAVFLITGACVKNTYDPLLIYDMFDRAGFKILRIDQFDSGNFAKIRTELKYDRLSTAQMLEITTRLMSLEKNENLDIHIVNIDMIHKTMRVDIMTREEEDTIFQPR
jgi:hypothetical protein